MIENKCKTKASIRKIMGIYLGEHNGHLMMSSNTHDNLLRGYGGTRMERKETGGKIYFHIYNGKKIVAEHIHCSKTGLLESKHDKRNFLKTTYEYNVGPCALIVKRESKNN